MGSLMMYSSLVVSNAYAASDESGGSVGGMFIGAVLGAVLVLVPLIMMSKTKRKATEANEYIKEEAGGYSEITSRRDNYVRTEVEQRKSN